MQEFLTWDKEVLVVFCLDPTNRIISREIVSVGIADASLVHPREVFRKAILSNAISIAISHNHPSGSPYPSDADIKVTNKLKESGILLGIKLLDHVIVGWKQTQETNPQTPQTETQSQT